MEKKNWKNKIEKREKAMDYVQMDWSEFKGKTVLDVGCAYGIWTVKAAVAGAEAVGLDIKKKWLEPYQMLCEENQVRLPFVVMDIVDGLPSWIYDQFDIIFLMAVLHHVDRPTILMEEVFRAAKKTVYLDMAITTGTLKSKGFLKRRKSWSWVPTEPVLLDEIRRLGGEVEYATYGNRNGCDRVFLKVKVSEL